MDGVETRWDGVETSLVAIKGRQVALDENLDFLVQVARATMAGSDEGLRGL